jgi:hypothetical protein
MEIKCRAWDKKREKMWTAEEMAEDQLTLMPDGSGFINVSGVSTKLSQRAPHLIPMLWTGRKDCKGTEIYDRDIISVGSNKYYVVWLDKMACFGLWSPYENLPLGT